MSYILNSRTAITKRSNIQQVWMDDKCGILLNVELVRYHNRTLLAGAYQAQEGMGLLCKVTMIYRLVWYLLDS